MTASPVPSIGFVERGIDWALSRVATLPSTNLRIAVTLGLITATGAAYLAVSVKAALFGLGKAFAETWKPDTYWLAFLLANAGVDAAQFLGKRMTEKPPNGGPPPEPPAAA